MSQESFAYSIEMLRTYLAEVEVGRRNVSIENVDRIARGLGVSLREFFDSELFADREGSPQQAKRERAWQRPKCAHECDGGSTRHARIARRRAALLA